MTSSIPVSVESHDLANLFRALGDPVRLAMVERLSSGMPATIGVVSAGFGITRQGARKHLQVLADTGLVTLRAQGRDVQVQLDPATLERARRFLSELEIQWETRLQALKRFVESE